jgi:hypothetical protein
MCVGTAAAAKAAKLTANSRIKIGDCDVTTKYDEAKKITYTNFKLFSFDDASSESGPGDSPGASRPVDDGEIEEGRDLPF